MARSLRDGPEPTRGFRKRMTATAHPDYRPFCQGTGHGTGYQDQIIIEARDFLRAIETGRTIWPSFRDGMAVNQIVAAVMASSNSKSWQQVDTF